MVNNQKKLTKRQVVDICKALNKGTKLKDLANKYKVSNQSISHIACKKTYPEIGEKYLKERIKNTNGVNNPHAKFNKRQVQNLRAMKRNKGYYKLVQYRIAKAYGVTPGAISQLLTGKTYQDV